MRRSILLGDFIEEHSTVAIANNDCGYGNLRWKALFASLYHFLEIQFTHVTAVTGQDKCNHKWPTTTASQIIYKKSVQKDIQERVIHRFDSWQLVKNPEKYSPQKRFRFCTISWISLLLMLGYCVCVYVCVWICTRVCVFIVIHRNYLFSRKFIFNLESL